MFSFQNMPIPTLGLRGLEPDLSEEERAIQESAHRFALEVMRPIGEQLDKMNPAEAIATGSPFWRYFEQIKTSGILDLGALTTMDNAQKSKIIPLIFEELGWGDSGLAISALAASFPAFTALGTGDPELIEQFSNKIGCWVGTQPDRGSDICDLDATEIHPGTQQNKPNLSAKIIDDGDLILTGQSSAWVSLGPVAEAGLVYAPCDYGDGICDDNGGQHQVAALVSFDDPKISKGKPLDKIGQRPLPQGEIFFDEVRVPKKNIIATLGEASGSFWGAFTFANMEMSFTFTGVARAAFDHTLAYVHERKQGGTALINHQSVRLRLFDMWRKVETCRALAHRVAQYNYNSNGPHLLASITAKTYVTQTAFEVASEAIQLYGGNGLTREYPVEKLLRDAKASTIEDGENNLLSLKGATWLSKWYENSH